jgi:hypothetical protein
LVAVVAEELVTVMEELAGLVVLRLVIPVVVPMAAELVVKGSAAGPEQVVVLGELVFMVLLTGGQELSTISLDFLCHLVAGDHRNDPMTQLQSMKQHTVCPDWAEAGAEASVDLI